MEKVNRNWKADFFNDVKPWGVAWRGVCEYLSDWGDTLIITSARPTAFGKKEKGLSEIDGPFPFTLTSLKKLQKKGMAYIYYNGPGYLQCQNLINIKKILEYAFETTNMESDESIDSIMRNETKR